MKSVFTLVCILSAAHYATADCGALKTYTTKLIPACDPNDLYIKWPNYANQSTYYVCLAVGYAELIPCPSGDYFTYVMQQCSPCDSYIPAVQCKDLKTENTPNCVAIDNSTTSTTTSSPTPIYPSTKNTTTGASTTTTASTTVSTTVVTPPTAKASTASSSSSSSTSTTSSTTTTAFPAPPTPATTAAGVPVPPTPAPTPPTIVEEPPMAV
ncbi:peritrophin-55 [Anastrepha ludens]|uniref:peritrophin-55 n=1 Tax=Anastrepha ludens TaxID=28586 RepID=UPI0023AE9B64|nr:peritrophin-55 [Anastrepha ludens]